MKTAVARLIVLVMLPFAWVPAFAGTFEGPETNTAITYVGGDGTRRIHDFAISHGTLVENYFNGSTWQWIEHPKPSDDYAALYSPFAITYEEGGTQRIYVFAITGNGHRFVVRYFNGTLWQWAQLPTATFLKRERIAVVTYVDELGARRIHLFAVDDATESNLVTTWWDGSTWKTRYFNSPKDTVTGPISAITYAERGVRRIDVFCVVNAFGPEPAGLYSLSWLRDGWHWVDLGLENFGAKSAITFLGTDNTRHTQLFGTGPNHSLAMYERSGSAWNLVDLGNPEPSSLTGPFEVSSITYMSNSGHRQILIAAIFNHHLYFKRHDGTDWSSFASFASSATDYADDPTMVFHPGTRTGNDTVQMFVSYADGLRRHRWNGTNWQSYSQGAP